MEAAKSVARVLVSPQPVCHLKAFGDSSLNFLLRFWIRDPVDGITNVRGQVLLALWDAFKREGIEIPFPVRDVRHHTGARPRLAERRKVAETARGLRPISYAAFRFARNSPMRSSAFRMFSVELA